MKFRAVLGILLCGLYLAGIFLPTIQANAVEPYDFTYEVYNGEITITGCTAKNIYALEIPTTIDGYPVVSIGTLAFEERIDLVRVTIPEGVRTIEPYAFYQCRYLRWVTFPDSLTTIGKNAFYGCDEIDILYIDKADSLARRSIQTVIYHTTFALATMLTPLIPHTTEEVYSYLPNKKEESIYLCDMPDATHHQNEEELLGKYAEFMSLRTDVLKALEMARNEKVIGKSLNAEVTLNPTPRLAKLILSLDVNLAQVFIVSKFNVVGTHIEGSITCESGEIKVQPATGHTCARCWQVVEHVDEDGLCERCKKIVG